jgi:DNA-binding MarR family transcriptional regulator
MNYFKNTAELSLKASVKGYWINHNFMGRCDGVTVIPNSLLTDQALKLDERLVIAYLISYNFKNSGVGYKGFVFPRVETIASDLGISRRQVFDKILGIEEKGYIYRISNRSIIDYYDSIEYINKFFDLHINEATLYFLDLWKCLSKEEIMRYNGIDSEIDYEEMLKERNEFIEYFDSLRGIEDKEELDEYLGNKEVTGNCTPPCAETRTPPYAETRTQKHTNIKNTNIKNNNATHFQSKSFFTHLLNTDIKKEDFDKPLSYKEAKSLKEQKKKKEHQEKKDKISQEFLDKLSKKEFKNFNVDELCLYYEHRLKEIYGTACKVSERSFRTFKLLYEQNGSYGLTMEQLAKVVDVFLETYREGKIKGLDLESYPNPIYAHLLLNNKGSILKQIINLSEYSGVPTVAGSGSVVYKEDSDYRDKLPELMELWKHEKPKWLKKYGLIDGKEDRNYMRRIKWVPNDYFEDDDIPSFGRYISRWFVNGYLTDEVKDKISSQDFMYLEDYVENVMIPANEEYDEIQKAIHEKVYGIGTDIRIGGLV